MVASLKAIKSAAAAVDYFSKVDDYYRGHESAPATWLGKAAEQLGLVGAVDPVAFQKLLGGRLPDGQQLGRINQDGELEHKPGWDMTFSAPKSVSAMALVAGDDRLIAAHEAAVCETLAWLEHEAAVTRVRERGEAAQIVQTGNLAIAIFRHATSREQQPQLHTHAVILNLTCREDGEWRSLESRPFYRLQLEAGARYRAALAMKVAALGYETERTRCGREGWGFEIKGVPAALLRYWSKRSEQVNEHLAERGQTRETASAAERDIAAVSTRKSNGAADHADLRTGWRDEALEHNADLQAVKTAAQERAIDPHWQASVSENALQAAREAVAEASAHLAERQARFTDHDLMQEARRLAMGHAGDEATRAAIDQAKAAGELEARTARGFDHRSGQIVEQAGYTTREAVTAELQILAVAGRSQGKAEPLSNDPEAAQQRQEARSGFAFNLRQAEALAGILASRDSLHLLQGYAGTAKTTSVLAAVAAEAAAQGLPVTALAPTASAAQTLAGAVGGEGITVAKHLATGGRQGGLWIVDEASMLSAKDTQRLLAQAEREKARVVLVGDVKQLGSVEAGAAFRQLQQESRLRTHVLDEIVRQTNKATREAVEAAIKGNAAAAMEKIQEGGGLVRELATREERVAAIVEDYCKQTAAERARSIVIAPGRDDRAELNTAIRERLKAQAVIKGEAVKIDTLTARDLTRTQAKRAENYEEGDMLRAGRAYEKWGIEKGDYLWVKNIDAERNIIRAEKADGRVIEINPRTATKFHAFEVEARELQVGDRIVFRHNDDGLGRKNGQTAEIVRLDAGSGKALAVTEKGKTVSIDLRDARHAHWTHAYAQTAHEAQGRTCDRVFIHAESGRVNLTNQQAFYVAVSRARETAHIYTDNRGALGLAVAERTGRKAQALETPMERSIGR